MVNVAFGKMTLMYDDGRNRGIAVDGDRNCRQSQIFDGGGHIAPYIFC